MGKVIDRVRAQRAIAFRNQLAEAKWDAYCRHLDAQTEARGRPMFVMTEPSEPARPWWAFWR